MQPAIPLLGISPRQLRQEVIFINKPKVPDTGMIENYNFLALGSKRGASIFERWDNWKEYKNVNLVTRKEVEDRNLISKIRQQSTLKARLI